MDFKYKDTSVFACNYLIFFYLKGTKARSTELQRVPGGQKEGNHSLLIYKHWAPTLRATLCATCFRETPREETERGGLTVCATSAIELQRLWRCKMWDFFPQRDEGESGGSAEVSRGFVEEPASALGLKHQEDSEEDITWCSLFTCFVNWKTRSLAQWYSRSMDCKPSSATNCDYSVTQSKLSDAPTAHPLHVKRKSLPFSRMSERSKWETAVKCMTEYLPNELLLLERECTRYQSKNEALSDEGNKVHEDHETTIS